MRIEIEIPKEFENDYETDKFGDFFGRVACDIIDGVACGNYEFETAEMFQKAFAESKVAYDVEAVVAELEASAEGAKDSKDLSKYSAYKTAIEIVRGKE